jgi:hypothetical protein
MMMNSQQTFPLCAHCGLRNHLGGKNACPVRGPHRSTGSNRSCAACIKQGLVTPGSFGVNPIVRPAVSQSIRPTQAQWVEQTAVWVVSVAAEADNQRVVFDATVPRFAELRRQFALVTLSSVTVEPVIDGTNTTGGSIVLSFTTDREVSHSREDIMGREDYLRVTGASAEQRLLSASLGGIYASRHIDVASRGGSPGLVLDWDSTVSIQCAIRIVARVRCVGPLAGSAGSAVPGGPVVPAWPVFVVGHLQSSTNVTGLRRVCIGKRNDGLVQGVGTSLRVQREGSEDIPITYNGVQISRGNYPLLNFLASVSYKVLTPGDNNFLIFQ